MSQADSENELRRTIERDRTSFLDQIESLVKKSPAQKIANGSYQNSLHKKGSFGGFYSELRAYVLANQFCSPRPADIAGGQGLPDLACDKFGTKGVDIEVTRLSSWDKMANVQDALENQFNGTPYMPFVEYFDHFFVMPYGYKDIQANEIFIEDILNKASNINPQNPPQKIRNHGIEVEFQHTSGGKGMMQTTSVRGFPTDPEGAINDRLQQKAEKQRGYRPLLIVLDSELSFFDSIDLKKIVLGTSVASAGGTKPAPLVRRYSRVWKKYMQQNGVLNIPAGRVGLFAEKEFSRVAGVLLIDVTEKCHFVPNCYTNDLSIRGIYQKASSVVDNLNLSKVI